MKQNLRQVLLPTFGQALGSLTASLLLIGVLYHNEILQRIENGSGTLPLNQIHYGSILAGVSDSPIIHFAVIFAFWGGVGLVAYTIVWSMINVMIEARNEVVLETEYTNKSALAQRLRTPLLQLALAAGLFAGLLASAKWVFPYWLKLADTAFRSTALTQTAAYGLAAVLGTGLTIYILILIGQLVFWLG